MKVILFYVVYNTFSNKKTKKKRTTKNMARSTFVSFNFDEIICEKFLKFN